MKQVSPALQAKLTEEEIVCFAIIEMTIDGTTYRYTDCDVPLVIDTNRYEPAPIKAGDANLSSDIGAASFTFKISAEMPGLKMAFIDGNPKKAPFIGRLVFLDHNYYGPKVTNVLTNHGFESGVLGDWHIHVGSGCAANASVVASSPYEGTYCAKIEITDSWGTGEHIKDILFQQHISAGLVAGYLYDLTFAAKASSARKIGADVQINTGATYPMFCNIDLTTDWQFFSIPYTCGENVGAGNAAFNFYLARENQNGVDVYIDQARFSDSLYPITLFKGRIDKWNSDEEWIDLRVSSPLATWSRKVVRRQPASCRWRLFKGEECRYVGASTWCDRTYKRCEDLGNTAHFGGFRWLPHIANKTIFWGRVPAAPVSGCSGGGRSGGYI